MSGMFGRVAEIIHDGKRRFEPADVTARNVLAALRELTEAMIEAARRCEPNDLNDVPTPDFDVSWRAMVDAILAEAAANQTTERE